jgi:Protein of unknown function (DUF4244)
MSRRWQRLTARPRAVARGDRGMTTAEYAVGTVAACGFGGILFKILTSDSVVHLMEGIISRALHFGF